MGINYRGETFSGYNKPKRDTTRRQEICCTC